MDFSSESVLLRRKAYWQVGRFRSVPIDRAGSPAGARWVEEARADPPAATVRPVDRNSPYTALLVCNDVIVFELAASASGLLDLLIAEILRLAGATPLVRRSPGVAALFYRGPPPHGSLGNVGWLGDEGSNAGALVVGAGNAVLVELDPTSETLFEWPEARPDQVGLDAVPELADPEAILAAAEGLLREAGYRPPPNLFDQVEIEEVWPLQTCWDEDDRKISDRGLGGVGDGGPPGPEPPPPEPPDGPPPEITVYAGERHRAADAGLKALYRLGVKFYNRSGELCRISTAPGKDSAGRAIDVPVIQAVLPAALGRLLGQAASWFRPLPKAGRYRVDPPAPIVMMIAAMADEWRFPPLIGIVRQPTLRPQDFSVISEPGYDRASGFWADFRGLKVPRIPARPTRREAETALTLLVQNLDSFPFVDARDRATAVAAQITVCVRTALPVVPGFAVNSPSPGSGKSYFTDCVSAIATGERAAVIAVASKEEETEKRLMGAALAGNQLIVLDNVRRLLEGDFLCQVTERPMMQLRPLGTSEMRVIRNVFTMIANGNNIVCAADLTRRFLRINFDPNVERPELRQFDSNPFQEILDHRGDFIAAGLTIVRYFVQAGRPNLRPRLGSYAEWSDLVRSTITHLGLPDPVLTQQDLIADDPVAGSRRAVVAAWAAIKTLGLGDDRGYRVRELIEEANRDADLMEALLEVAEGQGNLAGKLDHSRLTRWLARNENTIASGFKLVVDRSDASRPRWRLDPVVPADDFPR
jgi:putative DNA primase/helicase